MGGIGDTEAATAQLFRPPVRSSHMQHSADTPQGQHRLQVRPLHHIVKSRKLRIVDRRDDHVIATIAHGIEDKACGIGLKTVSHDRLVVKRS